MKQLWKKCLYLCTMGAVAAPVIIITPYLGGDANAQTSGSTSGSTSGTTSGTTSVYTAICSWSSSCGPSGGVTGVCSITKPGSTASTTTTTCLPSKGDVKKCISKAHTDCQTACTAAGGNGGVLAVTTSTDSCSSSTSTSTSSSYTYP